MVEDGSGWLREDSRNVLAKNYRRITEKTARAIHPAMFSFLDQFDSEGNLIDKS